MKKQSLIFILMLFVAAVSARAVEPEPAPVNGSAKVEVSPQPQGAIIDLFGHETGTRERPVLPESERELRRPESPRASDSTAKPDARVIDRRSRTTAGWSWTDAIPLAAVLGLIAIVALVIRRFLPARGLIGQTSGLLDVVARTPVSPKQSIILVRMGRRFLLLGVSPDQISTLCTVDDAESSAELLGEVASRRMDSSTAAFHNSFSLEEAEFANEDEADSASSAGGHVRGLLEKVRQMKRSRVA